MLILPSLGIHAISIHVPARGTTPAVRHLSEAGAISIHVPARGTTFSVLYDALRSGYFNPRPREGDDMVQHIMLTADFISIHVPARGTTARFV